MRKCPDCGDWLGYDGAGSFYCRKCNQWYTSKQLDELVKKAEKPKLRKTFQEETDTIRNGGDPAGMTFQ